MTTQITALPTAPSPGDAPSDFDAAAYAWTAALDGWTTEANALAVEVNAYATSADADAATAAAAATTATAASSFVGEWAAQVGAAALPYSVFHNGGYWALLTALADVTASEPGVSADWALTCSQAATAAGNLQAAGAFL